MNGFENQQNYRILDSKIHLLLSKPFSFDETNELHATYQVKHSLAIKVLRSKPIRVFSLGLIEEIVHITKKICKSIEDNRNQSLANPSPTGDKQTTAIIRAPTRLNCVSTAGVIYIHPDNYRELRVTYKNAKTNRPAIFTRPRTRSYRGRHKSAVNSTELSGSRLEVGSSLAALKIGGIISRLSSFVCLPENRKKKRRALAIIKFTRACSVLLGSKKRSFVFRC